MKTKVIKEVKKIRKNSKGEDVEYIEKVEQDVFYELDSQGNIKEEVKDQEQLR